MTRSQIDILLNLLRFWESFLDFLFGIISIPERRASRLKACLQECASSEFIQARPFFTGRIISMSCTIGNIARLLTRNYYSLLEQRSSWEQRLPLSPGVANEIPVWLKNIDSFNVKSMAP